MKKPLRSRPSFKALALALLFAAPPAGAAKAGGASYDPDGGYAVKAREARANIKLMNRDADARAPGSSQTPPLPRAQTLNVQNDVGRDTNVWNRIADYKDTGGF